MKKSLTLFMFIVLTVCMAFVSGASAATINAASCSQADVNAAISASATGDTVIVPSGSCTWTAPNAWTPAVSIPVQKKIVLQGQGIENTIISFGSNSMMLSFVSGVRVTEFTFREGYIQPTGRDWRIDHNKFERVISCTNNGIGVLPKSVSTLESVTGVIDHNQFYNSKVVVFGGPSNMAPEVWSRPLGLGTADAVYIEDNEYFPSCSVSKQIMDSNYGGAYVFRYNKVHGGTLEAHAVQGENRACRKWEVYNNLFSIGPLGYPWTVGYMRAGTGVWFNNSVVGAWEGSKIYIDEQRSCASKTTSGKCDGSSPWDRNTPGMSGYPCRDQIGRSTDTVKWVSTPGSEGSYTQALEPAYSWNNWKYPTETDRINKTNGVAIKFVVANVCPAETAHLVEGRDFYNSATAKPGYTPYTYPHPLTLVAGPAPAPAPAPALVPPPPPAPAPDVQPPPPVTKSWWRRLLRK